MKKRLLLIATAGNFSAKWGGRGEGGVGTGEWRYPTVWCVNPSSPLKLPIFRQFPNFSELLIIVNLEHLQFDRNSGK